MSEATIDQLDHRSLALAATFGAARLVQQLADDQSLDDREEELRHMLTAATVVRDPADWELIFSNLPALRRAAGAAVEILGNQQQDRRALLYGIQLIQLAELLGQQPAVRNKLAELIDALTNDEPATLAAVYRQSISHLGQRIQVTGSAKALQEPAVADQIRTLLLCGVRMAWLWLRLGGKRRQLVFGRRRIVDGLRTLVRELPAS